MRQLKSFFPLLYYYATLQLPLTINSFQNACYINKKSFCLNVKEGSVEGENKRTFEKEILVSKAEDDLQRISNRLKQVTSKSNTNDEIEYSEDYERVYKSFLSFSANFLKRQLDEYNLPSNGKKNDLAKRLTDYELKLWNIDNKKESAIRIEKKLVSNVSEKPVTKQVTTFASLKLSKKVSKSLTVAGFTKPTAIQEVAIPAIYDSENCILHAETGSGKTLAYLIPILEQPIVERDDI